MSDLSADRDALDRLDEEASRLGNAWSEIGLASALHPPADELPDAGRLAGQWAAAEADDLASRLAVLSAHPELGVGEARAAMAEAAAALSHQSRVVRAQSHLLTGIRLAQFGGKAAAPAAPLGHRVP